MTWINSAEIKDSERSFRVISAEYYFNTEIFKNCLQSLPIRNAIKYIGAITYTYLINL